MKSEPWEKKGPFFFFLLCRSFQITKCCVQTQLEFPVGHTVLKLDCNLILKKTFHSGWKNKLLYFTLYMALNSIRGWTLNSFIWKIRWFTMQVKFFCSHVCIIAYIFAHMRSHGNWCSCWDSFGPHHLFHWQTTATRHIKTKTTSKKCLRLNFFLYQYVHADLTKPLTSNN